MKCLLALCFYGAVIQASKLTWASEKSNIRERRDVIFSDEVRTGRVAQRKCNSYIAKTCDGNLEIIRDFLKPIVVGGGRAAFSQEYPHMALIGYGSTTDIKWGCDGTLISENFVLSAAHCSFSSTGDARWIRLGELDYSSDSDDAKPLDFPIFQKILHPRYKSPLLYNDIALFRFLGIKEFTDYIRPLCLNSFHRIDDPTNSAISWGTTAYAEVPSSQLLSMELKFEDISICNELIDTEKLPDGFDEMTMICVSNLELEKGTCQGNAGGSLQFAMRNTGCPAVTYSQTGILSSGVGCNFPNSSAIYTRISFYIPWIEKIVWNNSLK